MVVWAVANACGGWIARLHQLTVDTTPEGAATKLSGSVISQDLLEKDGILLHVYNIISPPGRRFIVESSGARRTSAPLWVEWGTYRL
jgi:hypothetical protein